MSARRAAKVPTVRRKGCCWSGTPLAVARASAGRRDANFLEFGVGRSAADVAAEAVERERFDRKIPLRYDAEGRRKLSVGGLWKSPRIGICMSEATLSIDMVRVRISFLTIRKFQEWHGRMMEAAFATENVQVKAGLALLKYAPR